MRKNLFSPDLYPYIPQKNMKTEHELILNLRNSNYSSFSKTPSGASSSHSTSFCGGKNEDEEIKNLEKTLEQKSKNFSDFLNYEKQECQDIFDKTVSKIDSVLCTDDLSTDFLKETLKQLEAEKTNENREKIIQAALDTFNEKCKKYTDIGFLSKKMESAQSATNKGVADILKKTKSIENMYEKSCALKDVPESVKNRLEADTLLMSHYDKMNAIVSGKKDHSMLAIRLLRHFNTSWFNFEGKVGGFMDEANALILKITDKANSMNDTPATMIDGFSEPLWLN